jgi:cytochrome b6-f complex iron-sulfur subunit
MERRSFFKWLFVSVSAMWGFGSLALITKYLKPADSPEKGGTNAIRIGPLESLPTGSARFFPHARQPVYVMRLSSNEVVAVSAVCTHFHCILNWDASARLFRCPCHRGSFDQFGNVLSGPPPSPLPKLQVETRRGEVYVVLS